MELPICPVSTRFEDSTYPIDSSLGTSKPLPYNPIATVIEIPKDASVKP